MMTAPQSTPPAAARHNVRFGYNHNFRHQGRVFHVQTEDSGPSHAHIYSHVFFAGTVIATRKTDYNHFGLGMQSDIQSLMQHSHREMCVSLRDGIYDERIAALTSRPAAVQRRRRTSPSIPAAVLAPQPGPVAGPVALAAVAPSLEDLAAGQEAMRRCLAAIHHGVAGFLGAAVVNQRDGLSVRALSTTLETLDMNVAVSGDAAMLQSKMQLLEQLDLDGTLEDILISLDQWFCIIRPLSAALFLYVIVDRTQGNLGMARRVISSAAGTFTL